MIYKLFYTILLFIYNILSIQIQYLNTIFYQFILLFSIIIFTSINL